MGPFTFSPSHEAQYIQPLKEFLKKHAVITSKPRGRRVLLWAGEIRVAEPRSWSEREGGQGLDGGEGDQDGEIKASMEARSSRSARESMSARMRATRGDQSDKGGDQGGEETSLWSKRDDSYSLEGGESLEGDEGLVVCEDEGNEGEIKAAEGGVRGEINAKEGSEKEDRKRKRESGLYMSSPKGVGSLVGGVPTYGVGSINELTRKVEP